MMWEPAPQRGSGVGGWRSPTKGLGFCRPVPGSGPPALSGFTWPGSKRGMLGIGYCVTSRILETVFDFVLQYFQDTKHNWMPNISRMPGH